MLNLLNAKTGLWVQRMFLFLVFYNSLKLWIIYCSWIIKGRINNSLKLRNSALSGRRSSIALILRTDTYYAATFLYEPLPRIIIGGTHLTLTPRISGLRYENYVSQVFTSQIYRSLQRREQINQGLLLNNGRHCVSLPCVLGPAVNASVVASVAP